VNGGRRCSVGRATRLGAGRGHRVAMTLKVAFVSRDPAIRLAGAKALGAAPPEWSIELADAPPPDADVVVCGPDVS
jgi:hypothetical protein